MKYYAIKAGKQTGIFTDWNTCKDFVIGYPNAVYKSFKTQEEAEAFLGNEIPSETKSETECHEPYAFVDGSYNQATNVYGYGGFLRYDDKEIVLQGSDSDDAASMRNVAGEIAGSMAAITKAIELGLPKITLYYDYKGIEEWATGAWKRNNDHTENYHTFMQKAMTKIDIKFVKVKGHSGVPGNERADKLAKESVGIK